MDKLTKRWYWGLIIVPFFKNIFTLDFSLLSLLANWELKLNVILLIIISILVFELYLAFKKIKLLISKPKESDKKIINKLINDLDFNLIYQEIVIQNSWYGYKIEAIRQLINFSNEVELPTNNTSDKNLNKLMIKLKKTIDEFNSYSSKVLFREIDSYVPLKNSPENIAKTEQTSKIMNKLTDDINKEMNNLKDYLKSNNYFE